jgi:microcystin-dependent protein
MGFSGGGGNVTKAHTHDSTIIQDGGSLAANVTQFGLTEGSILYSDGSNIQELAVGAATETLTVNTAATAPEWAAAPVAFSSGMIICWAGTNGNIPTGWLLCNGSSIATATYPDLHTAIGYVYGGSGANFNLPDLVDNFVRGQSTQTAATGGADSLTLTEAQMPTHTHVVTDPGHVHNTGKEGSARYEDSLRALATASGTYQTASATTGITLANTGSSSSFDNKPAYLEMQYIIKT